MPHGVSKKVDKAFDLLLVARVLSIKIQAVEAVVQHYMTADFTNTLRFSIVSVPLMLVP